MKSVIFVCLIALACSQGFLRNLQTDTTTSNDGEVAPLNGSNATNATNSSGNASANSSLGQIAAVDLSGNWTVLNTNCSAGQACAPTYMIQNGGNQTTINIMITYPQDQSCGQNAGQTLNVSELALAGVWFDFNNQSNNSLAGSIGIWNPINQSILLVRQDENNAGAYCWEDLTLGAANNTQNASGVAAGATTADQETAPVQNATNATNTTNVTFEGAWQASAVQLAYDGAPCCVPDVPVLIHVNNQTNVINYALRAPNCAACGVFQNSVLFGNGTLQQGVLIDETTYAQYGIDVVFYATANGTVRAVYPTCAIEFTNVAAPSC